LLAKLEELRTKKTRKGHAAVAEWKRPEEQRARTAFRDEGGEVHVKNKRGHGPTNSKEKDNEYK